MAFIRTVELIDFFEYVLLILGDLVSLLTPTAQNNHWYTV